MFDDNPIQNNGGIPGNLPMKEPEDIFSGADNSVPAEATSSAPSALDSGVLRAKAMGVADEPKPLARDDVKPVQPPISEPLSAPQPLQTQQNNELKDPGMGRSIIVVVVVVIAVGLLAGGSYWIYSSFIKSKKTTDESLFGNVSNQPTTEDKTEIKQPIITESNATGTVETSVEIIDEQVLFGEPIDSDGDGLDDVRETDLTTDPNNWDTDGDELSDYDEVVIWKTDPLDSDTDGDTYLDGAEVKSGYSPTGQGRLFQPPTETK